MATAQILKIPTALPGRAHRSTRSYLSPAELLAVRKKVARARSTRDWMHDTRRLPATDSRVLRFADRKLSDVNLRDGSIAIRRLKGSMNQVQPLYRHKGQPLLDEVVAPAHGFVIARTMAREFCFCLRRAVRCIDLRPSLSSPRSHDAGLPPRKDTLITTCHASEPSRRGQRQSRPRAPMLRPQVHQQHDAVCWRERSASRRSSSNRAHGPF